MDNKDFLQSKSTWGAIVLLLAPLLNIFGIDIDEGAVTEAVTVVVGGLIFVWGQLTRSTKINSIAGIKVTS